ncbi:MAG TPA: nuclear transport factor 2 family protein [Steroidobacteraceae bacterium]|nr:nuclear transport factor 2 family protein [Steroidobacteraceae bacterium]
MAEIKYFVVSAAAAFVCTACIENALANSANAANTGEKAAPGGPTKFALVALEKSAYEAWKSKDAKFWDTFLSERFVGWGSFGRLDKASATKEYTGADCLIKSYALSDEKMSPRGKNAGLITYKVTVDGTCGGLKIPANSWAASVYVRDGDQWKAAFHAEDTIVDLKAAPANPVDKKEARKEEDANPTDQDARTDAMLAVEKAVWEAWRAHDAKKIADLTARDISFINIFGTYLATKADALKNWSGAGCDAKSVGVTDAAGTMLSPTVGILTFKATADGTCYGQKIGPIWGSSIYVKDGDAWKWTFGINVPAGRQGG